MANAAAATNLASIPNLSPRSILCPKELNPGPSLTRFPCTARRAREAENLI
jgi:hypothetical protein